jgi:hypothetical protein
MTDNGYKTDRGWHFSDLYKFKVAETPEELAKIKDDYQGAFKTPGSPGTPEASQQQQNSASNAGITIKIAATHAGLITRNNGFYMPDKMKSGVSTWTEHYLKPIQVHHEDHRDPVGRVVSARYVDTSSSAIQQFQNSALRDSYKREVGKADRAFWDAFTSDKTSFIKKLDMMKMIDSVLLDPSYQGVGYIELTANITDPDAIQKVLDGRYITGSVGAVSDKAVCSVCNMDWLEESEPCGHRPGKLYDGKKCVIVAGNLEYDEYSFVNTPADRRSGVITQSAGGIQNSVEDKNIKDSKIISFFPIFEEDVLVKDNVKDESVLESQVTTDTKIEPEVKDSKDEETKVVVSNPLTVLLDKVFTGVALTEEENDSLYELQLSEMDKEVIEDAKLSAVKRKKMASSAFCGPEKSFPVSDCAHVTAARKLVDKYEGTADKSKVVACIDRKAKAFGCDSVKDSVKPEVKVQDSVQEVVPTPLEHDFTFASKVVGEITDQVKLDLSKTFLSQLLDKFGKDSLQSAALELGLGVNPEQVTALEEEVAKSEETVGELRDQLNILRKELRAAYDDIGVVEDQLISKNEELLKTKTDKLKFLHALDGSLTDELNTKIANLSDKDLTSHIDSVSTRVDIQKIADKINSGLSRTPNEKVEAPPGLTEQVEAQIIQKPTFVTQQLVDQVYRQLLLSNGQEAANSYYSDMVKRNLAKRKED